MKQIHLLSFFIALTVLMWIAIILNINELTLSGAIVLSITNGLFTFFCIHQLYAHYKHHKRNKELDNKLNESMREMNELFDELKEKMNVITPITPLEELKLMEMIDPELAKKGKEAFATKEQYDKCEQCDKDECPIRVTSIFYDSTVN